MDDWSFIPGPRWLLAAASLAGTLVLLGVGWVLHRVRVGGAKLARQRAACDYPDQTIQGCVLFKVGHLRFVELTMEKAGKVVYQIAVKEEAAFRVDDPR